MPRRLTPPTPPQQIRDPKKLNPKPGDNITSQTVTLPRDRAYLEETVPNFSELEQQGTSFFLDSDGRRRLSPSETLDDGSQESENPLLRTNPLSYFRESSYQLELSIVREGDTKDEDFYKKLINKEIDEVVIAQTGVSSFNIESFDLEQVVSGSPATRNTYHTKMNMTIIEPMGFSMFDVLFRAGVKLGIFDWIKCPYIVKLKFNGYDPNTGEPVDKIGTTVNSNFQWIWTVQMTNVDTELNEGGVRYQLSMIPINEFGYNDTLFKLPSGITLKTPRDGQKVGEILQDLETKINRANAEAYDRDPGDSRTWINTFFISAYHKLPNIQGMKNISSPDLREWKINEEPDESTRTESSTDTGNERLVSAEDEKSIARVIEDLFLKTLEYRTLLNRDELYSENDRDIKEVYEIKVVPEVLYSGAYDNKRKIYRKIVIFHVVPFRTFALIPSARPDENTTGDQPTVQESPDFLEISRRRAEYMKEQNVLFKEYKYWFTGENTEIIDFDMSLNHMWYASSPVFKGLYSYYSTHKPQLIPDDEADEDADRQNNNESDIMSASDFNRTTGTPERIYAGELEINEDDLRIFVIGEDITRQSDNRYVATGSYSSTNPQLENVATHILGQSYSVDMAKINMTIKGDPYWLGIPNSYPLIQIIQGELNNQPIGGDSSLEFPKYYTGQVTSLLEFKFPESKGTHGQVNYSQSAVFSGLYIVYKLTHSFTSGSFTTQLEAYRDPASLPLKAVPER